MGGEPFDEDRLVIWTNLSDHVVHHLARGGRRHGQNWGANADRSFLGWVGTAAM